MNDSVEGELEVGGKLYAYHMWPASEAGILRGTYIAATRYSYASKTDEDFYVVQGHTQAEAVENLKRAIVEGKGVTK